MKVNYQYALKLLVVSIIGISSCSREKMDKEIKADITVKARTEVDFAGINYIVDNGVVVLTGLCPSQKAIENVQSTVRKIAGVKEVRNQITMGSVVLNQDFPLKQSVDSVLMKYNLAQAIVANGSVILTGQVPKKEVHKLLESLNKLQVTKINNQLSHQ